MHIRSSATKSGWAEIAKVRLGCPGLGAVEGFKRRRPRFQAALCGVGARTRDRPPAWCTASESETPSDPPQSRYPMAGATRHRRHDRTPAVPRPERCKGSHENRPQTQQAAFPTASRGDRPCCCACNVKSTIMIAFFLTIPISRMMPTIPSTDRSWPQSINASSAPNPQTAVSR